MKTRTFLPIVAVLFAAITLPTQTFAQSTNVKTPNKNQSAKFKSVIVKGSGNSIESNSITSFIGGGQSNTIFAGSTNGVIGGGFDNVVSNHFATVGGGTDNEASGFGAMVGGGEHNYASGRKATLSGGDENTASGRFTAIGGGVNNTASGEYATVPGGVRGKAIHDGSFVWSGWDGGDTVSVQTNSFTVRAPGGARFLTTTATNPFGLVGVVIGPGETAWTALSDRESKTDFQSIEPREVLSKLAAMPVTSWKYKHDPSRRYIGPTSQDFMAAFHLGNYDKGINTLDADGVTFAAIKGLVDELKERDKAMAARDQTIEELKAKNSELSRSIEAINERLNLLPSAP